MADPFSIGGPPPEFNAAAGSKARLAVLLYLGQRPQGASLADLAAVVAAVIGHPLTPNSLSWFIQSLRRDGLIARSGSRRGGG